MKLKRNEKHLFSIGTGLSSLLLLNGLTVWVSTFQRYQDCLSISFGGIGVGSSLKRRNNIEMNE